MVNSKPTSRQRILAAAAAVASEAGASNLSLDAVAQRAGVSKGGLLYNFPTKAKLLQGLVQNHIDEFEISLAAATEAGNGASLLGAYLRSCVRECASDDARPSGVLAALAEDPDMLEPVKLHKRRLLDRLAAETSDPARMLQSFLVVEGLRSQTLLDIDVLTNEERGLVLAALLAEAEWADAAAMENAATA